MSLIRVFLEGGPPYLPVHHRTQRVPTVAETFKLPLGAGYEHFRHQGESTEVDGEPVPVLHWFMRTAIAE
jgi:hypothetical protein